VDQEKEVKVIVTYNQNGDYSLQLPNSKELLNVRGKLEGQELTAFIGDQLINATVVLNEFDLYLFYNGNNYVLKIPVKDYGGGEISKGSLLSPMPGKILEVLVQVNQKVKKR